MPLVKGRRISGTRILSETPHATYVPVMEKTANYTCTYDDVGTMIIANNANGATGFTLPPVKNGVHYYFVNKVNQSMYVYSANGANMIGFNGTGSNNLAISTNNEKSGACVWVTCDGTKWYAISMGKSTVTLS